MNIIFWQIDRAWLLHRRCVRQMFVEIELAWEQAQAKQKGN